MVTALKRKPIDLSLIVAFSKCEEFVGHQVRQAAEHFRALGRSFQIVAVNEGARDNSVAILNLLARRVPELSVVARDCSGRAFTRGAVEAQGDNLILSSCRNETAEGLGPWSVLGWALGQILPDGGGQDAVVCRGRWVVARRQTCLSHIVRTGGASKGFDRRFEAASQDLRLQSVGAGRVESSLTDLREMLLSPLRRLAPASGQ